jgi:hypothetical protein
MVMSEKIAKTTFTFVVLHRSDEDVATWDLTDVLEECDTGHAVGQVTRTLTDAVPDKDVPMELKKLGNDGEFFDPDLNPDDDD